MAENDAKYDCSFTKIYKYTDDTHSLHMLNEMNILRQNAVFCDVTIRVDDIDFTCHRLVLASCSAYFRAMFSSNMAESRQETVTISNMEAHIMKLILEYAYTSQVVITEDNVQALLSASNLLEVISVRDACCTYLCKNMDETNCIGIYSFADTHSCIDLQAGAKDFILKNFSNVYKQDEMLSLCKSELMEIISDDKLIVGSEETVFTAILRWYQHSEETRRHEFVEMLEHVRLALLSPSSLKNIQKEVIIQQSDRCMELIQEAQAYLLSKDYSVPLSRAQPRQYLGSLCQFESGDIVDMDYLPSGHIITICGGGLNVLVYEENGHEADHPLVDLCKYLGHATGVSVNSSLSTVAVIENGITDGLGRLHMYFVDDAWRHQVYELTACKNPIYLSYVIDDEIIIVDYDDTVYKYTNNGVLIWEKNTSNLNIMCVTMDGLGRIIICYSDHVAVHDSDCNEMFTFPENSAEKLELRAICVDSRNNILVADYGSEAIFLYNSDGQFLRQLLKLDREPMSMSLYEDHHLAVCMSDDMLYVYHINHLLCRQ